jgi:hypothetical protein
MNGMMTWRSSLVAGSKIIFTSRFTTSSATFSGMTRPNISTNNRTRSGCPSLTGRYIIGRESPQAAKENPFFSAVGCAFGALGRTTPARAAVAARVESKPRRLTPAGVGFCAIIGPFKHAQLQNAPYTPNPRASLRNRG